MILYDFVCFRGGFFRDTGGVILKIDCFMMNSLDMFLKKQTHQLNL